MKRIICLSVLIAIFAITALAQDSAKQRSDQVPASNYTALNPVTFTQTTHIKGRFKATGGSHNDIQMLIMDSDEFENFKNNNQFKAFYDSGKVTVGKFDVTLAPGTYVIVYNNKWSLITPKVVTTWFED